MQKIKKFFKKLYQKTVWGRLRILENRVAEMQKKKISDRTQEENAPVPFSQVMDEWMNGKEDD